MSKPVISVIIPTHNSAQHILHCIDSITSQDFPRDSYEIIIVDDGSTDGTIQISKEAGADQIIETEPCFQGKARNIGAKKANSDVLAFIDSDCTAKPGWLQSIKKNIPEKKAISGPVSNGNPQSSVAWAEYFLEFGGWDQSKPNSRIRFLPGCNQAFSRDSFEKTGGFTEKRASEDVLLGQALRDSKIDAFFIPEMQIDHLCRTDMTRVKKNMSLLGHYSVRARKQFPQMKYSFLMTKKSMVPILFLGKLAKAASHAIHAKKFGVFLSAFPLVVSAAFSFCMGASEELSQKQ